MIDFAQSPYNSKTERETSRLPKHLHGLPTSEREPVRTEREETKGQKGGTKKGQGAESMITE